MSKRWRYKRNCPAAHGRDRCTHDTVQVTASDPRWIPASDRRRLEAAIAALMSRE